ncbi:CDP-glycerol glycerophosphotransferase family protein [Fictibacillus fluitans]|uniref:CDP-glycerol glycerophosphotransferase family protein n=1 Tax=Fictibacillus fluitans TaxID=3058422 RepID=A0ABT8HZ85_9BACL|nr:CDP-glycerol glycerophosphotransferase family protein [Fictibacillus sp. NE201]MDN4526093.1 CDP-glycerol glycerophosphotransferase family protein [Fictibacillus sp. NE201]
MGRELAITVYLILFNILFNLFKLFPSQDRLAFVLSFGDNASYLYEALKKRDDQKAAFLCTTEKSVSGLKDYPDANVIQFQNKNISGTLRSIYWLATSRKIILDNYYGFLAGIQFKENTECIQIWHAAGAIKRFGIRDASVEGRSLKAQKRFLSVYEKFHKIAVGSRAMEDIFREAFALSGDQFLRTGLPRTDLFFNELKQNGIKKQLLHDNPDLKDKELILYAPTYRDHQLDQFELELDLGKLQNELGAGYAVILKLHPALKGTVHYEEEYPGFVYNYSFHHDVNDLMLIVDYLITDYSSIPYEFALLDKPMIFYPYDLKEYTDQRGLWDNYAALIPGPVVYSTEEIISVIRNQSFEWKRQQEFKTKWNEFHQGNSSEKLISYLLDNKHQTGTGEG